jgi:hypothetical protein
MPTIGSVREDKLLGNLSAKYRNAEFVADRVFPMVSVKKNSDVYRVYERQFRLPETDRAIGAEAKQHNFLVSSSSYVLEKHGLKEFIADDIKSNYDVGDLMADTVEELTDTILRRMEKSVLDLFTTTSWSQNTSLAAANAWTANTTVSNPILAVDTATSQVLLNSGKMPNVGLMNHAGLEPTKNHVSILDRVKYVSAEVSEVMLAGLFGLEELMISRAGIDSSAEGATSSLGYILGDVFWTGYRARPSLKSQGAGFIFRKPQPLVKRWREESRESDVVEVNMQYVPKIVSSLSGYLIKDIL